MSGRGKPNPDGDWMDALKEAMRVDPALRKKHDDRPPLRLGPRAVERVVEPTPVAAPEPEPSAVEDPELYPWTRSRPAEPAVVTPPPPPQPPVAPPPDRLDTEFPPLPAVYVRHPEKIVGPVQRLLDGCEPLLQLLCRLNRMKRTGESSDRFRPDAVRVELESALDRVAASGPAGVALVEPLQGLVDVVVTRAGFPFARRWQSLAVTGAPDRLFLSAAAAAVGQPALRDDGTWAALHACLSLTADLLPAVDGLPSGTELLDGLDAELYAAPVERICPSAYEGVFDHAILPSVGNRLRIIAAVSVGVLLVSIGVALVLNLLYLRQMGRSIERVTPALVEPAR